MASRTSTNNITFHRVTRTECDYCVTMPFVNGRKGSLNLPHMAPTYQVGKSNGVACLYAVYRRACLANMLYSGAVISIICIVIRTKKTFKLNKLTNLQPLAP
jgi:hypothetical protein